MIDIVYEREEYKRDVERRLTLKGHANHSENGHDIVCAAVSAITVLLTELLGSAYPGQLITSGGAGDVYILFQSGKGSEADKFADTVFDSFSEAVMQLHEQYPKNVSFDLDVQRGEME